MSSAFKSLIPACGRKYKKRKLSNKPGLWLYVFKAATGKEKQRTSEAPLPYSGIFYLKPTDLIECSMDQH